MSIQEIKLPRLPIGTPIVEDNNSASTTFAIWWNSVCDQLESSVNGVIDAQNAADAAQAAAVTAQAAAVTAQASATTATAAAATAQATATTAQGDTTANAREQALVTSGISPTSVLTVSSTTISIAPHTRVYGDGTTVSVSGGSVSTIGATGTIDYVFYSDPSRAGGSVTYQCSTTPPVQGNDIHVVGAVTVPSAGTFPGGRGPQYPGYVEP